MADFAAGLCATTTLFVCLFAPRPHLSSKERRHIDSRSDWTMFSCSVLSLIRPNLASKQTDSFGLTRTSLWLSTDFIVEIPRKDPEISSKQSVRSRSSAPAQAKSCSRSTATAARLPDSSLGWHRLSISSPKAEQHNASKHPFLHFGSPVFCLTEHKSEIEPTLWES